MALTISGTIYDSKNKPIPGISVKILRNYIKIGSGSSDTDGTYSTFFEPGGPITVIFSRSDYITAPYRSLYGQKSHSISPKLDYINGTSKYTDAEASSITDALTAYISDQKLFIKEIGLYKGSFSKTQFPSTIFQNRLQDFEEKASLIKIFPCDIALDMSTYNSNCGEAQKGNMIDR